MKIKYGTLEKKFVETRLIAYIGNKRRLIPLIKKAFEYCSINSKNPDDIPTFYDPFSGTGVISRFAKTQGFKVVANDWEYYSYIINKLYIEMDNDDVEKAFEDLGSIEEVIEGLNYLPPLNYKNSYITRYYCPKNTKKPDLLNERLFYTRETGEKIDAVREEIDDIVKDEMNKDNPSKIKAKQRFYALLSPLLYEASARSNTSGVFKAFHNGFGGTNQDALSRIFKTLKLEKPVLWKNITKHKVFRSDAIKLSKRLSKVMKFDIAYIDPPYNQHQYGSNYHLLNTIAYNDKPPINKKVLVKGKKTNKSAIRKDWVKTKSGFCYKNEAYELFHKLIQNINAKYILVSYSIDGIIEFDDMLDFLIERGSLDIVTSKYVKYPGGKQSLKRDTNNIEFVLIVNTEKKGHKRNKTKVYSKLIDEKIPLYLGKTVSVKKLTTLGYLLYSEKEFIKSYRKKIKNYTVEVDIYNDYSFYEQGETIRYIDKNNKFKVLSKIPLKVKEIFLNDLETACDLTKEDELNMILSIIEKNMNKGHYDIVYSYLPQIPYLLNKFNNRKAYESSLKMIIKISKTFSQTKINNTLETKKVMTTIRKLHRIVSNKLSHKNSSIEDMIMLKKSVKKEYYEKIAKKYELNV